MPDRFIRDRARRSPTLAKLTDGGERAWWRLMSVADDYGCFAADGEVLLAECFTRRPEGWTVPRMRRVREEWITVGLVHIYAVADPDGEVQEYGHVLTWGKYQRVRDSRRRFPDPPCNGDALSPKCAESRQSAASRGESPRFAAPSVSVSVSESVAVSVSARRQTRQLAASRREDGSAPSDGASPGSPVFQIPEPIRTALERAPRFHAVAALHRAGYWQAQLRACPTVDHASELLKAHAWVEANPRRAPKRDVPRFLHRWFAKAAEDAGDE
jgi:hypothetical protein